MTKIAAALLALTAVTGFFMTGFWGLSAKTMNDVSNEEGEGDIYGIVYEKISLANTSSVSEERYALVNVTVTVEDVDMATTTGANGTFTLEDVPLGDRVLVFELAGYRTVEYMLLHMVDLEKPPSDALQEGGTFGEDIEYLRIRMEPGADEKPKEDGSDVTAGELYQVFMTCTVLLAIMSVIALIGAYFAYKRKRYAIAMVGCFSGILVQGPGVNLSFCFLGIGSIMSLIALMLLLFSKEAFAGKGAKMSGGKDKDDEPWEKEPWEDEYRKKVRKGRAHRDDDDDDYDDHATGGGGPDDDLDEEEKRTLKKMRASSRGRKGEKGGEAGRGGRVPKRKPRGRK